MRRNKAFTELYIKSLAPKEKEFCVSEGHGFTIRVLPSGVKTFWYYYSLMGRRKKLNLGTYPDVSLSEARKKYREAANLVVDKVDPSVPSKMPSVDELERISVKTLVDMYTKHIATHLVEISVKLQSARLQKHVVPVWGERDVLDIRRRDAIFLIEKIAASKPGAARNVLLAARAMFTYALRREMFEYNPFSEVGLAVPAASPNDRTRVLSDDELKQVVIPYLLSPTGNTVIKKALFLILVTGQRPGEVVGMRQREIDGDWWTIPYSRIKTERRKGKKNPQDHRVFLTQLAKSAVQAFEDFIFPASRGASGAIRTNTISHHIEYYDPPYLGIDRWTPHDLRRTARTGMAALRVAERHAEAVLNHAQAGVKKIYDRHHYDDEKKEALSLWSLHLNKLIDEVVANATHNRM
jgi:integrase